MRVFDGVAPFISEAFEDRFSADILEQIAKEARTAYVELTEGRTGVSAQQTRLFLRVALVQVAFFEAVRGRGLEVDEVGLRIYRAVENQLRAMPAWAMSPLPSPSAATTDRADISTVPVVVVTFTMRRSGRRGPSFPRASAQ